MAPRARPAKDIVEKKLQDDDVEMNSDSDSGSPSVAVESGIERWRASESPKESFSDAEGANEDGEWRYQIIGEEVRHDGNISFEVMWEDWRRADGTRTTWHHQGDSTIDSTRWASSQKKLRRQKASESMEIEIMTTTDIHNTATFLRSQAFEEKLRRAQKEPQPNWIEETAKLMSKHQEHVHPSGPSISTQGSSSFSAKTSQRATTRQQTEGSHASLSSATVRGSSKNSGRSSVTIPVPIPPPTTPQMSLKAQGKQRENFPSGIVPSIDASPEPPLVLPSPKKRVKRVLSESEDEVLHLRNNNSKLEPPKIGPPKKEAKRARVEQPMQGRFKLQQEWSRIAEGCSAAKISFVNEVDEEVIPPLDPTFRYLERSYEYAPGIDLPDMGFLLVCSCLACEEPTGCECQDSSEFVDDVGKAMHAYTPTGLFAFNVPKNLEVVECNQGCHCSLSACKNRVSQRPRDVPIEIFKTRSRGWGARAAVAVKRGKVLGIYTGRVLRRADARKLPTRLGAYTFDLDGDEQDDVQLTHEKYTVDSRCQGNWTRFINHSCMPNLQIYLVVHDTPTNTGMPYIAFVATEDMPARTEFTIDYNPAAAAAEEAARSKAKKGKSFRPQVKRPEGAMDCCCNAIKCRGFI